MGASLGFQTSGFPASTGCVRAHGGNPVAVSRLTYLPQLKLPYL